MRAWGGQRLEPHSAQYEPDLRLRPIAAVLALVHGLRGHGVAAGRPTGTSEACTAIPQSGRTGADRHDHSDEGEAMSNAKGWTRRGALRTGGAALGALLPPAGTRAQLRTGPRAGDDFYRYVDAS